MDQHYTPPGKCRFTPLYGAAHGSPICYMLDINGFVMLLDCGWNDSFDVQLLQPVLQVVSRVDAVLLSHPDTQHLGALPYLVGRAGMAAPVYCTFPTYKMGQLVMYDHCHSRQETEDFELFSLDDIDEAFRATVRVRYSQTVKLTGKGSGICLTAHAAGHLLGGSVWRISAGGEEVVYAMDYNHAKEAHLNGSSLAQLFSRPALMLTDAAGAMYKAPDRGKRDAQLFDLILSTLRADGNVLIPSDTAGRVLELMLLLDKYWHEHKLVYPVVLLTSVAPTVVAFAKSCIDWLNDSLARSFLYNLDNPFALKCMKLCTSRGALGALPHGPKVVVASSPSLEAGLSRTMLFEWAADPRNVIVFTSPPQPGSLAATLLNHAQQQQQQQKQQPPAATAAAKPAPASAAANGTSTAAADSPATAAPAAAAAGGEGGGGRQPLVIKMKMSRRVFLEGEELEKWLEAKERERNGGVKKEEAEEEGDVDLAPAPSKPGRSKPSWDKPLRSSSGVLTRLGRAGSGATLLKADSMSMDDTDMAEVLLDGFTRPPGAAVPMFPDEDEPFTTHWDEYGAAVDEAMFKPSQTPMAPEAAEAEEAAAVVEERPTKVVAVDANVRVEAQVVYFDYEGRSDGLSVSTFLTQIAPQHLVLLHGTPQGNAKLAQHCSSELKQLHTTIHTPGDGDVVELELTAQLRSLLSEGLMEEVQPHRLGAYSLAWVEGLLRLCNPAEPPLLEPARRRGAGGGSTHGGIFIGDVKLSDVKQALEGRHIDVHFGYGGTLVCAGGQVLVKKGEQSGHLVLEGAMSEDYYRVREVLYGQYNIC